MFQALAVKESKVNLRNLKWNVAAADHGVGREGTDRGSGGRLLQRVVPMQMRSILVAVGSPEGLKHRKIIMRYKILKYHSGYRKEHCLRFAELWAGQNFWCWGWSRGQGWSRPDCQWRDVNPPRTQTLVGKLIWKSKAGDITISLVLDGETGPQMRPHIQQRSLEGSSRGPEVIAFASVGFPILTSWMLLDGQETVLGWVYSDEMPSDFPGNDESSTKKIGNPHLSRKLSHLKLQFPPFLTLCLGPQPHSTTIGWFPCQELEQMHHSTGV